MQSDSYFINVPLNSSTLLFDKSKYNAKKMAEYISIEEFNKIIDKCNNITERAWIEKNVENEQNISPWAIWAINFSKLFAGLYIIFTFLSILKSDELVIFIIAFVFVILGTLIITGLALYNYFRKIPEFSSLTSVINRGIAELFEEVNKTYAGKLIFKYYPKKEYFEIQLLKYRGTSNTTLIKEDMTRLLEEHKRQEEEEKEHIRDLNQEIEMKKLN